MTRMRDPWLTVDPKALRRECDALGIVIPGKRTAKACYLAIQEHKAALAGTALSPDACTECGLEHKCGRCGGARRAHDAYLCDNCQGDIETTATAAHEMREAPLASVVEATVRADAAAAVESVAREIETPAPEQLDASRAMAEQMRAESDERVAERIVGTDLVHAPARFPSMERWHAIEQMSMRLAQARLVKGKQLTTPEDVMLVLLGAHDLGVSSTMALQQMHVIDGKLTISGQLMLALVRQAGFSITPETMTAERAVARGVRGTEVGTFEFTIEEARVADLLGKNNWKSWPKMMCWWRAVSGLCRIMFPDVLNGLGYTPEELGAADTDPDGNVIDAVGWEVARGGSRDDEYDPRPAGAGGDAGDHGGEALTDDERFGTVLLDSCDAGDHDGTGTCCKEIIAARAAALPEDIRVIMKDEWRELRAAHELRHFGGLRESDRERLQELFSDAETAAFGDEYDPEDDADGVDANGVHDDGADDAEIVNDPGEPSPGGMTRDHIENNEQPAVVDVLARELGATVEHVAPGEPRQAGDQSFDTRAARAREIVAQAARRAEAEMPCPHCGVAMNVDNPKCSAHPFG